MHRILLRNPKARRGRGKKGKTCFENFRTDLLWTPKKRILISVDANLDLINLNANTDLNKSCSMQKSNHIIKQKHQIFEIFPNSLEYIYRFFIRDHVMDFTMVRWPAVRNKITLTVTRFYTCQGVLLMPLLHT